jgi:hypothetical protein
MNKSLTPYGVFMLCFDSCYCFVGGDGETDQYYQQYWISSMMDLLQ